MEDLVKQYPQCLLWVDIMKQDRCFHNIRFKKLKVGYPRFVLYPNLIDEVNLDTFIKSEQNRLPLFIDSQFGINPSLEDVFKKDDEGKLIAVLNKSLLSGVVVGLKICVVSNYELKEISFFKN